MRHLKLVPPVRRCCIDDKFTTRLLSGCVELVPVSAYPDQGVYLRTGMEFEFDQCIWYRVYGGIMISRFRWATLLRTNTLRLRENGKEVCIHDLGPAQTATVVLRSDVRQQLRLHGITAA